MRVLDTRLQVRRRVFLRGAVTAVPTALLAAANVAALSDDAWAVDAVALKPQTMILLVRMGRDIYPHDRIADRYYIAAMRPIDAKAAKDDTIRAMIESGAATLDEQAHRSFQLPYARIPEESDRVPLLRQIDHTPFFKRIHSDMTVSFYNQHDMWPRFGYEGSSSEYGGYLTRGFDDINWLPKV